VKVSPFISTLYIHILIATCSSSRRPTEWQYLKAKRWGV